MTEAVMLEKGVDPCTGVVADDGVGDIDDDVDDDAADGSSELMVVI